VLLVKHLVWCIGTQGDSVNPNPLQFEGRPYEGIGNGVPILGALEVVNLFLVQTDNPKWRVRVISMPIVDKPVDRGVVLDSRIFSLLVFRGN